VINKEGLCPRSGDINRLMMMMMAFLEKREKCDSVVLSRILLGGWGSGVDPIKQNYGTIAQ
jgi:hypothetical protein